MLTLHSSSSCDICCESYNQDDGAPTVLSCGHVMCVFAIDPPLCPMCRETYNPALQHSYITSVPVDDKSSSALVRKDTSSDTEEDDFLRRIVLSWNKPSEEVEELVSEAEYWLACQTIDKGHVVREALDALDKAEMAKGYEASLHLQVKELNDNLHSNSKRAVRRPFSSRQ
ncbi:hypothetical protein BDQ17DRAFT_1357104 [Cyathus striatus]|nr:hypothetical protein BDQ17DRAFT_1357104 [Cyathus striatus]